MGFIAFISLVLILQKSYELSGITKILQESRVPQRSPSSQDSTVIFTFKENPHIAYLMND